MIQRQVQYIGSMPGEMHCGQAMRGKQVQCRGV